MPGIGVAVSPCFGQRAGAAAFTPADLGAKLDFWLVATDADVARSGSDVTTWSSLGGGGGNATAVATKAPTYNATGWSDGSPTVDFVNVPGSALELALLSPAGDDHWSAGVMNVTSGATSQGFYSPFGAILYSPNRAGFVGFFDGGWRLSTLSASTGEQALIWIHDSSVPGATAYKNGTASGAVYGGTAAGAAINPTIGARAVDQNGEYLGARVKVAMGGQGILTASEIANLVAYLGSF